MFGRNRIVDRKNAVIGRRLIGIQMNDYSFNLDLFKPTFLHLSSYCFKGHINNPLSFTFSYLTRYTCTYIKYLTNVRQLRH